MRDIVHIDRYFCSTPGVALARAVVHPKHALHMLLTAEPVDAERAMALGLVNSIAAQPGDDGLHAHVMALSKSIIRHSATVIALGKRTFYEQLQSSSKATAYNIAGVRVSCV